MADEKSGILVLRAVIGVGVDDQLRIGDVLLHDEGVDRGHDYVVAAAPLVHRCNLGGRNLVVHLGIAPLTLGRLSEGVSGGWRRLRIRRVLVAAWEPFFWKSVVQPLRRF